MLFGGREPTERVPSARRFMEAATGRVMSRAEDAILTAAPETAGEIIVVEGGRWYVAHTRSRNEKALADELSRLHIPNYLPLAQRITRSPTTRRISRSLVPVFPGYVFFHGTEEHRHSALRTNRIAHVLHVTDQAQIVRELAGIHELLSTHADF